jgi:HD-like signal output (HDOD) protein
VAPVNQITMTVERLVEQTRTVYSLPLFYERLNDAINHPRTSIDDITKIITEDQGLTARILKLANSPLFGYYCKVDSISKAVTIIGTRQLRDLALASSVIRIFRGIPEELVSMEPFWKHSICCGIIARSLATYLREGNVERFFVTGILHDVGQLAMCAVMPEVMRETIVSSRDNRQLYHQTERMRLGFDHAEAGAALFRTWKIPASIFEPVACHHLPFTAKQFPLEAAVIHLADIICQGLELGSSAEWCVTPLDQSAWQLLGLPAGVLDTVIRQSEPQIEETCAILGEDA